MIDLPFCACNAFRHVQQYKHLPWIILVKPNFGRPGIIRISCLCECKCKCKCNRIQMFILHFHSFADFVMIFGQTMPLICVSFFETNAFTCHSIVMHLHSGPQHLWLFYCVVFRILAVNLQQFHFGLGEKRTQLMLSETWKCMFTVLVWWITLPSWLHMLRQCHIHSHSIVSITFFE